MKGDMDHRFWTHLWKCPTCRPTFTLKLDPPVLCGFGLALYRLMTRDERDHFVNTRIWSRNSVAVRRGFISSKGIGCGNELEYVYL